MIKELDIEALELNDNDLWIRRCDKFIKSMSEHEAESVVPFFYQTSSHILIAMITLKYYFMNEDLHKTELIDLVMKHDIHHRTPLSENKYIDDCISKGYLHVLPSSKGHRKKVIIASDKMIKEMAEWLLEHSVTDT